MHIYGLTGGIGTGKSTVARMLAEKGAAIVDADAIAREVVEPGSDGLREIVRAFGETILDEKGGLDRVRMGEVVFADPDKRKALESITHPRIVARMGERIAAAAERGAQVAILDVPLFYETGAVRGAVEKVIVAYAPASAQTTRVAARDGLSVDQIEARMTSQMDIEEKRRRADFVVENTGSLAETQRQVDELWPLLLRGG